ncbi:hypothetical protein ACP275_09G141400 [Erythranthe tilingii]
MLLFVAVGAFSLYVRLCVVIDSLVFFLSRCRFPIRGQKAVWIPWKTKGCLEMQAHVLAMPPELVQRGCLHHLQTFQSPLLVSLVLLLFPIAKSSSRYSLN